MVSPTTLIRRASKAKSKAAATRLRRQAAKMRREIRAEKRSASLNAAVRKAAKKAARPTAKKTTHSDASIAADNVQPIQSVLPEAQGQAIAGGQSVPFQRMPIERPALVDYNEVERLRRLAFRKRSDSFEEAIAALANGSKISGRAEMMDRLKSAEAAHIERLKHMQEVNTINIVSSFMARVEAAQAANRGPLPATITFDGYTIARVYDALRGAGYTTEGRDSGFRKRS